MVVPWWRWTRTDPLSSDRNWRSTQTPCRYRRMKRCSPLSDPRVGAHSPTGTGHLTALDWSPDGQSLLFSTSGGIEILDVETGGSQKVADGNYGRWSPSGDWISYVTPQRHATILNLRTHETKMIDPRSEMAWQVEWSPDGKLLLLPEAGGIYFGF